MIEIDYPQVRLPGDDDYWNGYDWGRDLDKTFPGQDAQDFAYAIHYNERGPLVEHALTGLLMVKQGYNDGDDWIWLVRLGNGHHWWLQGGCDYTGWDCWSSVKWTPWI